MSIQFLLKQRLVQYGMFESQADQVIELAKKEQNLVDMQGRWDDNENDYPPALIAVTWFAVKQVALKWIDYNLPKAWYRSQFE